MDLTFRNRLWAILLLLCLTTSFSFFIALRLLGWGTTLLATVVGLILAMVSFVVTMPRE